MRPSFGGSGGGMGRGSGRGGDMVRSVVHRVLSSGGGCGPPEPFSTSSNSTTISTADSEEDKNFSKRQSSPPNTGLTLASGDHNNKNRPPAFSRLINHPESGASFAAAAAYDDDDGDDADADGDDDADADGDVEWECVDVNNEDERALVFNAGFVFGPAPLTDEVNYAITALQQVSESLSHAACTITDKVAEDSYDDVENEDNRTEGSHGRMIISSESEVDWIEPSMILENNSRMLQAYGSDRVYDAFHMLQNDPSVKRMVIALSSDKAVWDAVLNNEVVKELRRAVSRGDNCSDKASGDDENPLKDILSWVIVNAKAKIMQLIDKIAELANLFQPPNEENIGNALQERLKTSLFLSIVVLLIVVVNRAKTA